jgi:hypothetical protein
VARAAADPEFKANLRVRTSHAVRGRRPLRLLAYVGAACVLLGLAARWRHNPSADVPPPDQQAARPQAPVDEPAAPAALEWQAFDGPRPLRAQRYRDAGNQYLDQTQDFAAALRCYEQALASAAAGEREIDANDNWLMMALKIDQKRREN